MNSKTQKSKFLSYVLRHQPEAIGLTLDASGWADINELINKADIPITRDEIEEIVATNDKRRFIISDDGQRIRANQGHSIDIDLELQPKEPPEWLYHGTAKRFVDVIEREGLKPMERQHVHLSADIETANSVGTRHGSPAVFKIPPKTMHNDGFKFYKAKNGVWLFDRVPEIYLVSIELG